MSLVEFDLRNCDFWSFDGSFGFMRRYKEDVLNPKKKDTSLEKLPRNV